MRKLLSLIFGLAAVVGVETMFGRKPEMEVEIDPNTGRETLLSMLVRRQNEIKAQKIRR